MTRTLLSSVFVLLALAAPQYSCPQARPSETSVEKKMDALFSGSPIFLPMEDQSQFGIF